MGDEEKIPYLTANSYPAMYGDRIFMVSEIVNPAYEESKIPTWVGNSCRISYVNSEKEMFGKKNHWKEIGVITPDISGFPRNHNPGFLTDPKSHIPDEKSLVVFFTTAETGSDWLWSYDLYSAIFKFNNK